MKKSTSKSGKATKAPAVEDGSKVNVIGGTNAGKSGIARDMTIGKTHKQLSITVVQANGERFKTLAKNVVVV
jgi:ribosomal protein S4E